MTRSIEFIKQKVAICNWIRHVWHVEVVVKVIQLWWLRRWRHDANTHSLLLCWLRREAKIDRLLMSVRVRMTIWWHMSHRSRLCLRALSCVLATTALSPACCAVVLHDWRTITTGTSIQAALLTDSSRVLVGLVITSPTIEIKSRLYIGLFVGRLCDAGFEGIYM